MQDSSAFQYIAIDQIHESTTNPRQTFEPTKLEELAESIRQHGLLHDLFFQPWPRMRPGPLGFSREHKIAPGETLRFLPIPSSR